MSRSMLSSARSSLRWSSGSGAPMSISTQTGVDLHSSQYCGEPGSTGLHAPQSKQLRSISDLLNRSTNQDQIPVVIDDMFVVGLIPRAHLPDVGEPLIVQQGLNLPRVPLGFPPCRPCLGDKL